MKELVEELLGSFFDTITSDLKIIILQNLITLIQHSPYNGKIISKNDSISIFQNLLFYITQTKEDKIFNELFKLLSLLMSYDITTENLRKYFEVMYSFAKTEKDYINKNSKFHKMVRTLSIENDSHPENFFDFDGLFSGFELPPINSFPNSYTITCWFRAETFIDPTQYSFSPCLFSFYNNDGVGIDASFLGKQKNGTANLLIKFMTLEKFKKEQTITNTEYSFSDKCWYHLAITHTSSSMLRKSELILVVNGNETFKSHVRNPNFTQALTKCFIGTSHTKHSTFFGQITNIQFFKHALEVDEITRLYHQGLNYNLTHENDLGLSKKLFFSFHPRATIDDVVLDTSSDLLSKYHVNVQSYDAKRMANTYVATGNSVTSCIVSVGGLDAIYPLFLYPIYPQIPFSYTEELSEQLTEYNATLLSLFVTLLKSQPLFQNQITNRNGFKDIRLLLQNHAPHNLSEDLLEPIEKIIIISEVNPLLRKQIFQDLLLCFSLWSTADVNFQKCYLSLLTSYILNDSDFFQKNSINVEFFLEILQDYYWFTEHPFTQLNDESFSVTSSTLTEFKRARLEKEEITDLRSYLLKFIKNSILVVFSTEDAQSLINYLQSCKDNNQVEDLLSLILEILLFNHNTKKFLVKFEEVGSIIPFLSFLSNEDESIRILTLKIISTLIVIDTTKSQVVNYVVSSKTAKYIKDLNVYSYIWCALNDFPITIRTYNALFEMASGTGSLDYRNPPRPTLTARQTFKNTQFLRIMFALLPTADLEMSEMILNDFYTLLLKNDQAKILFINDPLFMSWIASLFRSLYQPKKENEKTSDILNNLIQDILNLIINYCFQQKDGWKGIELFDNCLSNYFETDPIKNLQYQFEYYNFILNLFSDHINYLDLNSKVVPTIFLTLGYTTLIIDEYLFNQQEFLSQSRNLQSFSDDLINEAKKKEFFVILSILDLLDPLLSSTAIEAINLDMSGSKKRTLYVTVLRLILYSLILSYEFEYLPSKEHQTFLDKSSCRLQFLLGKLVKFNSYTNVNIWVLHYLIKCTNFHHSRYHGTLQHSTSKIIQEILNNCRVAIESQLNIPLPDVRQETPESVIKDNILSLKYNTELTNYFFNIAKALEKDLSVSLKNSIDRRKRRDDDFLTTSVDEVLLEISMIERNAAIRRKNWIITEVKSHREIEYKWDSYYQYLTHNDKYPWLFSNKPLYWKLDLAEDQSRRRFKLRINYDGDHLRNLQNRNPVHKIYQLIDYNDELINFNKLFSPVFKDEVSVLSVPCLEIIFSNEIKGKLHITDKAMYFFALDKSDIKNEQKDRRWSLQSIEKIQRMRYILRNSALEIFFTDRRSYFFTFKGNDRERVYSALVRQLPPHFLELFYKTSTELHKHYDLSAKWQRREISNFDYLMALNSLASRTLNDLSQYPVFPWIITDYQSSTIDLKNPQIYRDLSKPIGALNPTRLENFQMLYDENDDPNIPRYYYGTHYSNPLIVLLFLMRMEPFTTYYIQMQGGVDRADRLFYRMDSTWKGCYEAQQDLRELIPEFFFNPLFLCNHNQLNLGITQDNEKVSDVVLPPWANGSAEQFIRINNDALESEYVSEHLHEWIDLIFGYKQRGPDADAAKNIFVHHSYEGEIDIDKLDEGMRSATIQQILLYGHCPMQLFTKPHPPRNSSSSPDLNNSNLNNSNINNSNINNSINNESLNNSNNNIQNSGIYGSNNSLNNSNNNNNNNNASVNISNNYYHSNRYLESIFEKISIFQQVGSISVPFTPRQLIVTNRKVVSFSTSGQYQYHKFYFSNEVVQATEIYQCSSLSFFPFCSVELQNASRYSVDIENHFLFSCQNWDNSVRVSALKNPSNILHSVCLHHSHVSCIELTENSEFLVSGEVDCTIIVWEIKRKQKDILVPLRMLNGSDSKLISLAVSTNLDMIISGYSNGTLLIHTLHTGFYVRTIDDPNCCLEGGVDLLKVTVEAKIIAYSHKSSILVIYDVNGNLLAKKKFDSPINCLCPTANGKYLIVGSQKLSFLRISDLSIYFEMDNEDEICSISITPNNEFLFLGSYASGRNVKVYSLKEHAPDLYYNIMPFVNEIV